MINHELDWIPIKVEILKLIEHLEQDYRNRAGEDRLNSSLYDGTGSVISHLKAGRYFMPSKIPEIHRNQYSQLYEEARTIYDDAYQQIGTAHYEGMSFVEFVQLAYKYPVVLDLYNPLIPSDDFFEKAKYAFRLPPKWTPTVNATWQTRYLNQPSYLNRPVLPFGGGVHATA